jgi:hypothetical protein
MRYGSAATPGRATGSFRGVPSPVASASHRKLFKRRGSARGYGVRQRRGLGPRVDDEEGTVAGWEGLIPVVTEESPTT